MALTQSQLAAGLGNNPMWSGGGSSNLQEIYGTKPSVPMPTQTATSAIQGNLGNMAGIYGLSTGTGQASGAGQAAQYNTLLPNLPSYLSSAGANVTSELSGQLPAGVMAQLAQGAAQNTWGSGGATSGAYEQALGLTSLGMEQQGQKDLAQLIGETPVGPAYNPQAAQVTPGEQQSAAAANAIYGSAPNPAAAGQANMGAALSGLNMGAGAGRAPAASAYGTLGAPPTMNFGMGGGSDYGMLGAPPTTVLPQAGDMSGAQSSFNPYSSGGTNYADPWGTGSQLDLSSLRSGYGDAYNNAVDDSIFLYDQ